jgi:tRNA nucleotidyltransferase/poly(A) polymerase
MKGVFYKTPLAVHLQLKTHASSAETLRTGLSHLKEIILKDKPNATVFSLGGEMCGEIFLVGGYLRHLVSKGIQSKDIDYVVRRNVRNVAGAVSDRHGGTLVELRKENILRVALREGTTLDFSRLRLPIEDDLMTRDFTVNALAWSPESGLIDPAGGVRDIRKGIIRQIRGENFLDDPLRLLRAYRIKAQLSWGIDNRTRKSIRGLHEKIGLPASERITLEFIKLICSEEPSAALEEALEDGLLGQIISLSFNDLGQNIKRLSNIGSILKKIPEKYRSRDIPQGLSYLGLLRLEALLDKSKSDLLCLSRNVRNRLNTVKKWHEKYIGIESLSRREVFELFSSSLEAAVDFLVLSDRLEGHLKDLERFIRMERKPLVRADEIIKMTGLQPGPELGQAINEIKCLRFEGALRNRASINKWLLRNS